MADGWRAQIRQLAETEITELISARRMVHSHDPPRYRIVTSLFVRLWDHYIRSRPADG